MLRLITATDTLLRGAKAKVARVMKDTDGATAIEYGLIAAGIAIVIIAAVAAVGGALTTMFDTISAAL